jgi:hypothetical protein
MIMEADALTGDAGTPLNVRAKSSAVMPLMVISGAALTVTVYGWVVSSSAVTV